MSSTDDVQDTIIVGGGAAGLMAAASAASRGRRVLVLEKNVKLGVKVLISGGTRCNITHRCDARGIADAFGRQGKFLHSALAALSPDEVIEKIESLGVATKVESTGKIFPVSNRAIDVRDALVRLATDAGATILTEQPVRRIDRVTGDTVDETPQFQVHSDDRLFRARTLVVTTGGRSFPGCGTTGDGYAWAEQFGHTIVRTVPALTPVVSHQDWVCALKGITIEDVQLAVYSESPSAIGRRKPLDVGRGPLLFTHFGFSGPTAMNLSRTIAQREEKVSQGDRLTMRCDFRPTQSDEQLIDHFRRQKQAAGRQPANQLIAAFFPRRLAESLLTQADIAANQKIAELSRMQMQRLADVIKRNDIPIHGTLGYKKAEVTAGGISLKEIDSRNMQSKLVVGLFFAGEILDVDGPIGGYNFQAAFSTGWLAGQNV